MSLGVFKMTIYVILIDSHIVCDIIEKVHCLHIDIMK